MARGLTVLMLVLLIGNPFCCCAFGHTTTPADSSVPSCCRARLDAAVPGAATAPATNEEAPLNCPCQKEPGVVTQGELLPPVAQVANPVPPISFRGMAPPPDAREISPGHFLHPGRYGPAAVAPPFYLLYGVFRC